EDVLEPGDVNLPHRPPSRAVEPHRVEDSLGRGQGDQGLGPEHVGDDRSDADPGDLLSPAERADGAMNAPAFPDEPGAQSLSQVAAADDQGGRAQGEGSGSSASGAALASVSGQPASR